MRTPDYFASFVSETCRRLGKCVCWEQGGPHASLIWPEMDAAHWRDAALTAVKSKPNIKAAKFVEPRAESPNWIFLASTAAG